jgi:hypothetical protein
MEKRELSKQDFDVIERALKQLAEHEAPPIAARAAHLRDLFQTANTAWVETEE